MLFSNSIIRGADVCLFLQHRVGVKKAVRGMQQQKICQGRYLMAWFLIYYGQSSKLSNINHLENITNSKSMTSTLTNKQVWEKYISTLILNWHVWNLKQPETIYLKSISITDRKKVIRWHLTTVHSNSKFLIKLLHDRIFLQPTSIIDYEMLNN